MNTLVNLWMQIYNFNDDTGLEMLDGALSQDPTLVKIYDKWLNNEMNDSVLKPHHAAMLANVMQNVVNEIEENIGVD